MKIIFHGGLPKTGTTSIQSFLKRQPNDIDGRIIYYPKGFRNNGAHHLQIAEALGCHPNFTQDLGILNYHRQTIREFASCAAEHKSAALVLSCEVFSMNPCGAKFGDLLAKGLNYLFGDLAPNVTYLFYVREPVSWSISMYNQLVRSGRISVSPLVYASNISENFGAWNPDILQVFQGYQQATKAIGGSLEIKPFSRDLLLRGDITADFLSTIGYDSEPSSISKTLNKAESVDGRIIEIILDYSSRINRLLGFAEARALSSSLSRYFKGETNSLALFSEEDLLNLFNYFAPIYNSIESTVPVGKKARMFLRDCASCEYLLRKQDELSLVLSLQSSQLSYQDK